MILYSVIQDFIFLQDQTIASVVLGSVLISMVIAGVGCFSFLQKKSLIGDSIAHATLPGVCVAFLLFHQKDPWIMLLGAFVSGAISLHIVNVLIAHTRLKADAAIAIVLSIFFAIGLMLLSLVRKTGLSAQSGLDHFLFGKAASMVQKDIYFFLILAVLVTLYLVFSFNKLKVFVFDKEYAFSRGMNISLVSIGLSLVTVVVISAGISTVGVVMVAALLITPAAAARFWTHNLVKMILLASFFGLISGWLGALVSFLLPSMPTGPWIIVVSSMIAFLSFIFGSDKGWLKLFLNQKEYSKKVNLENALKIFFHIGERDNSFFEWRTKSDLLQRRQMKEGVINKVLKQLLKDGLLLTDGKKYRLTEKGYEQSVKTIRLHRLWELYLTEKMNIAQDHVHEDAEAIEHILTPEIQVELEQLLVATDFDPHLKEIPKIK